MADLTGLIALGRLTHRFEDQVKGARLTILIHENREEIARYLLEGLGDNIQVQASSGEYTNHLAVLKAGRHTYTFARDYREVYISEIDYCACRITPDANGVAVYHRDYPGVVYDVSRILAEHRINISKLNVAREQKGRQALLVSITDECISAEVVSALGALPEVNRVVSLA